VSPGEHSFHRCESVEDFRAQYESTLGVPAWQVADAVIAPEVPKAIFLTGSIPLGMATSGSDVDFIVLIDDRSALHLAGERETNTQQRIAFSNEANPLIAGSMVSSIRGVAVEIQVAVVPAIQAVFKRLRSKGPELAESEIMTLGRLATGWQVHQTPGYLSERRLEFSSPPLHVYCSTRNFVTALNYRQKALKALELGDIPLVLHLGRSSVEMACLSYFASEGLSYLGARWIAQLGYARGASERLLRHPLLKQSIPLLFPALDREGTAAGEYLGSVSEYLTAMRKLIGQKMLFRIAFQACPQIYAL